MNVVVVLAGVYTAIIAFGKGPQRGFVDAFIPILFFLPSFFTWKAPSLPEMSFFHWSVIAVFAAYASRGFPGFKFSWMDLVLYTYVGVQFYSEFRAAGYKEAQNLLFVKIFAVVLPYVLAKGIIEPSGMRVEFAKKLVYTVALVGVLSFYEFKMGATLFTLVLDPFFPGQNTWVTTFRHGFARTAGPYGHAILCGVVVGATFRVHRWLQWSGHYNFKKKSHLKLLTFMLFFFSVMTMCRGPWIGCGAGLMPIIISKAKQRLRMFLLITSCAVAVGTPAYLSFMAYASVGRENAKDDSQETACYRKELLDKYAGIAAEKYYFGWGRLDWPKVQGMPSIDNHILLITIMHGSVTKWLFLFFFFGQSFRLALYGARVPRHLDANLLAFTFIGIFLVYLLSVATVFMGEQTEPMLFLMLGWSEALLMRKGKGEIDPRSGSSRAPVEAQHALPFRFRAVMS